MNYRRIVTACLLGLLLCAKAFAQDEGGAGAPAPGPSYIELQPPFIANFGGTGKLKYLKTEIALRMDDSPVAGVGVRHHMPYIRHVLVMLLSRQSAENLATTEGREALRQEALEEVRRVLMEEEGEQHVVDLLFSSFVVQGL